MNEEKDIERQPSTDDNPQQEQQLNQPSTDETSYAAEQPKTINNKSETEDMEVHHHTHAAHGKKNWKSYFWEFLMLFLAVFCGFLAEYQLEHKLERDRAREYAKALVSDLTADTVGLKADLDGLSITIAFLDSLESNLRKQMNGEKISGAKLYFYSFFSPGSYQFSVKTATLNQLKNSGSLRYFRNFELIRLINDYDEAISVQMGREGIDLNTYNKLKEAQAHVFGFNQQKKLEHLLKENFQSRDSILTIDLPLMNNNMEALNILAFAANGRKTNLKRREKEYYRKPYIIAIELINALKKEYHLE